ncbi:MAG: hypothetical protein H7832_04900 [Magnetococcus sp. DMHC-6]
MQSPKVLTWLFVQALVHRPHLNVVVPKLGYFVVMNDSNRSDKKIKNKTPWGIASPNPPAI